MAAGTYYVGVSGFPNSAYNPSTPNSGSASFGGGFYTLAITDTSGFITLNGIDPDDRSGGSVSSAGDINGDGFDDLIIGASVADPNGPSSGESYVVFGGSSFSASLNLSTLNGTNGFVINGIDPGDISGGSVSSAGDINGDGFDDLIIGAIFAAPNGPSSGESYVVFGGLSFSASLNLSSLNGSNGFVINGIDPGDNSGGSVSSAGDINGDGFDDLIIGAVSAAPNGVDSGESYVVFGRSSFSASLNLSSLNGTNGFVINGIDPDDNSGFSVSSAGDINGDGFDDLIIGAKFADPNAIQLAGESYVFFGQATGFSAIFNLSSINGSNGFVINGIDASDLMGTSVSSAGDWNGDGFNDLIIGASSADPNGSNSGESYVILGRNFRNLTQLRGTSAPETINGTASNDLMIAGAGNDTLIGNGGTDLFYGGQGDDLLILSANTTFLRIDGGNGVDTLRWGNVPLDLSSIADNRITNIEVIDLATTFGAQTLTVTPRDVLNLSTTTNELRVDRTDSDTVVLGAGWSIEGVDTRNGNTYLVYRAGEARMLVQTTTNFLGGALSTNLSNPNLIDYTWNSPVGDNDVAFSFDGATNVLTQTVTKFNGVATNSTFRFMGITGNIVLQGSSGKDTIDASGIADMSLLGRTAPTLLGGGGSDSLLGSPGPDFISTDGAEGADTIDGGAGNDTIHSGGGADSVRGGFGNDNIVDGGEGRDIIDAGDGNDTVQAGDGADSVIGGSGNGILIGDAADSGRTDRDTLIGGSGRDILMGGLGADSLDGGVGEDIIIAGNHSAADLALSYIMLEWTSTRTFAQRTANIAGTGTGPRANFNNFLQVGTTVVNDNTVDSNNVPVNVVDIALGGVTAGESDCFFADNPIDTRSDFQAGVDLLTDLSP